MCTHSVDDLLPHAPLHCAATGEMVKCSLIAGTGKNNYVALSKKVSKDTSRYESVKNALLTSDHEVETEKSEKSATN